MHPCKCFRADFSAAALLPARETAFAELGSSIAAGATVSFCGRVRTEQDGATISALDLECYPEMLQAQLDKLLSEARARFPDLQAAWLWHRIGSAEVGEALVLVQTAAPRRKLCFDAAQFLMDYLKTSAPIWKSYRQQDDVRWIAAKISDKTAWSAWQHQT